MKAFLLILLAYSLLPAQLKVKYDRFEDQTSVMTDPQTISTSSGEITAFMLVVSAGKRMGPVDDLMLSIMFSKPNYDGSELFTISRKGRLKLTPVRVDESSAGFFVTRQTLKRILESDCRINSQEFRFPDSTKTAFRRFVAFIDSASSR